MTAYTLGLWVPVVLQDQRGYEPWCHTWSPHPLPERLRFDTLEGGVAVFHRVSGERHRIEGMDARFPIYRRVPPKP